MPLTDFKIKRKEKYKKKNKLRVAWNDNRGLPEENTLLGIISPIGHYKSPIGAILFNWGFGICSLGLLYQTHISPIPNWVYYLQLGIGGPQLRIICPIGDIYVSSVNA